MHTFLLLSFSAFHITCCVYGSGGIAGPGAALRGVGLFCLATVTDTGEVVKSLAPDLVAARNHPRG